MNRPVTFCAAAFSFSLVLLLVSCGPAPGVIELNKRIEDTKQLNRLPEIQAALDSLLSLVQSMEDANNRDVHTNRVPEIICSLPLFSKREIPAEDVEFFYLADGRTGKRGVVIIHRGGPIYEGIVYCPFDGGEALARTIHGGNVLIVPWTNGIYFYGFCI